MQRVRHLGQELKHVCERNTWRICENAQLMAHSPPPQIYLDASHTWAQDFWVGPQHTLCSGLGLLSQFVYFLIYQLY